LVSLLLAVGCSDTLHSSYSTAADARVDGAVKRGWLPEALPDSASDISESHNLDTNVGKGSFKFGVTDVDSFRRKLSPATPDQIERFAGSERLKSDGYTFHAVPGFILAVNWQSLKVHFVLDHRHR
jgi:hypothetical protein